MNKPSISAVIMARNEEKNIEDAIASLTFASQIVVADTGSKDRTMELANKAGAEVHSIYFDGYGASKNRALEYCHNDWIFAMDADERVSPELAAEIVQAAGENDSVNGYQVCRLSYFLGQPIRHSGWYPDFVLRFFRRGKGQYSCRLVHEKIELTGRIGKFKGLLFHYSYRDLDSYLEKMNIYSTMNAQELYKNGKKCGLMAMTFHPPATFIKMYILKAGFLDGYRGLLLAALSTFHVFTKYAKLRELAKRGQNG
jgi:glycosyltransferase involved in cell wall biosynthesis